LLGTAQEEEEVAVGVVVEVEDTGVVVEEMGVEVGIEVEVVGVWAVTAEVAVVVAEEGANATNATALDTLQGTAMKRNVAIGVTKLDILQEIARMSKPVVVIVEVVMVVDHSREVIEAVETAIIAESPAT